LVKLFSSKKRNLWSWDYSLPSTANQDFWSTRPQINKILLYHICCNIQNLDPNSSFLLTKWSFKFSLWQW
jgi:hypothetical protein